MNISAPSRAMGLCAWTVLSLSVVLLGACGGGNDTASTEPVAADFLVTGSVANDATQGKTLLVVDPATPQAPRLSVSLSGSANYVTTLAATVNVDTGLFKIYGASVAYYVKDGQVFQVGLRKADITVAKRISSLNTACSLGTDFPLQVGTDDAWITVNEAGTDGSCATTADNEKRYVRFDTPATTAATRLPAGVELIQLLPAQGSYSALFFLAHDKSGAASKLTLYSPALAPAGDVTGSEGLTAARLAGLSVPAASGHVIADGTLRRLVWSSAGATLSPGIHTFSGATDSTSLIADKTTSYFVDGLNAYRLAATGAPEVLATFNAANGNTLWMWLSTPTRLLIMQADSDNYAGNTHLSSLAKQGGVPVSLAVSPHTYPVGIAGEDVFYTTNAFARAPETVTLKRIRSDGTGESLLTDKANYYPGTVVSRDGSIFQYNVDGFLWCERAPADTDCRNGQLRQFSVSTGTTVTLGEFVHSGTYAGWDPLDFAGNSDDFMTGGPLVLVSTGRALSGTGLENEMYLAQPGIANSLVRVTAAP